MKINELDKLQKQLKNMEREAKKLEKGVSVSFGELFNSSFMNKYTNFSNFDEFLIAGNFKVETEEDFEAIPDKEFDEHVSGNTKFEDWQDMLDTAGSEYAAKKLGF